MTKILQRLAMVSLIVAASLTATLGSQNAQAVSADTTIQIDFPTILVLYHYDNITLDVSQADLATALGVTSTGTCTGDYCVELLGPAPITWNMTSTTIDAGIDVDPALAALTTLTSVNLVIDNAWGVRSIGAGVLNALVTGEDFTNTIDTLAVSGVGTNNPLPAPGLALDTGDIVFDLDLSTLDSSGSYVADFTITVTNP